MKNVSLITILKFKFFEFFIKNSKTLQYEKLKIYIIWLSHIFRFIHRIIYNTIMSIHKLCVVQVCQNCGIVANIIPFETGAMLRGNYTQCGSVFYTDGDVEIKGKSMFFTTDGDKETKETLDDHSVLYHGFVCDVCNLAFEIEDMYTYIRDLELECEHIDRVISHLKRVTRGIKIKITSNELKLQYFREHDADLNEYQQIRSENMDLLSQFVDIETKLLELYRARQNNSNKIILSLEEIFVNYTKVRCVYTIYGFVRCRFVDILKFFHPIEKYDAGLQESVQIEEIDEERNQNVVFVY